MKKLFFLALLMGVFAVSFAQSKISGTIVDEKSGKGIPFVNVGLFRQADSVFVSGAASDDKGVFALQGVPRGNYNLKISAIGYQTYEQVLEVNGNVDLGELKKLEGSWGITESPRGDNLHWLMLDEEGKIDRLFVRSASYPNWPALTVAVQGDIIPDFPLINKSFELCYACIDR